VSRAEENKQTLEEFLEHARLAWEAVANSSGPDPDLAEAAAWVLEPVTSADSHAMARMFRENLYGMQDDAALLERVVAGRGGGSALLAASRLKYTTLFVAVTLDKYLEDFFDALWKSADTGEDIKFLADG
jgi:hypothetical protein